MKTSIGKALKTKVSSETLREDTKPASGTESCMMSTTRQRMLAHLCRHPGTHLRGISEHMELSPASAMWHLRKLESRGYVARASMGRMTLFYPEGLVEEEDLEVFSVMNVPVNREVYDLVHDRPGIRRKEVAEGLNLGYHQALGSLAALGGAGLISEVKDGRQVRYFPTDKLKRTQAGLRERLTRYARKLSEKLKEDGLSPKTVRSVHGDSAIVLQSGGETVQIDIMPRLYDG